MTRRGWALLAFAVMMSVLWSGALTKPRVPDAPVPSEPQACGPDAWAAFERLDMALPVRDGETWRVRCVSTEVEFPADLPSTQFTIQSWDMPGTYYIYEWEILTNA
jgi:hypothetical protein